MCIRHCVLYIIRVYYTYAFEPKTGSIARAILISFRFRVVELISNVFWSITKNYTDIVKAKGLHIGGNLLLFHLSFFSAKEGEMPDIPVPRSEQMSDTTSTGKWNRFKSWLPNVRLNRSVSEVDPVGEINTNREQ